jgi:hypothetical protein
LSRGEKGIFLVSFAESHDNVVDNLSSKDHLTYQKAKERIMILPTNYRSPSGASSRKSKPQYEANAVSSSNGKKDKKTNKRSSSSSFSCSKVCNWCRKHSQRTGSSYIWTHCQEVKSQRDRNGTEMAGAVQKSLPLYGPIRPNGSSTPAHRLT